MSVIIKFLGFLGLLPSLMGFGAKSITPKRVIVPPAPVYQTLSLNYLYNVTISAGGNGYYKYTPTSDFYFVVETFGSYDTMLRVENTGTGTIVDDDSGRGLNAKIWFKGVAGQTIYIYTKFYSNSVSGSFNLQLRQQYFDMFAYDDSEGNSTIPDLNTPYNKFKDIFKSNKYENQSAEHALSMDERNLERINSEIMFFSGHGYKNSSTEMGFGVVFKEGDITTSTSLNMDETRVAMWSACYSANSTNSSDISIAEYSVNCGSKSAVGFKSEVSFSSARTFTNRFFTKLSTGATVNDSCKYASNGILWPWDNAKKYTIFGDSGIVITNSTTSNGTFNPNMLLRQSVTDINNNYDDLESERYKKFLLDKDEYRYYETINGFLTNSIVDVKYEKEVIISINDMRTPTDIVMPINIAEDKISVDNIINQSIQSNYEICNKNIIYYSFDDGMHPILVLDVLFSDSKSVFSENYAVDLFSGLQIDYCKINEISCM